MRLFLHTLQAYYTLRALSRTYPHRVDTDLDHPNLTTFASTESIQVEEP